MSAHRILSFRDEECAAFVVTPAHGPHGEDLVRSLRRQSFMITAGELCIREVVICGIGNSVLEAAQRMRDHHVGCLVVVQMHDGVRKPVGILTDRDIVIGPVAARQRDLAAIHVGEVMTQDLVTARERESVAAVLHRMRARGLRRLPVVDEAGGLQGLIALDDVIELLSEQMTELVELISREQQREGRHVR